MNKIVLHISLGLLFSTPALAKTNCFLVKENNTIIVSEGDCTSRHAPCSTFKIALSLIGYNEGLLTDETHPELPYKKGYADWISSWKQPHNPFLWMKNSCVWFSQVLTQNLGMNTFNDYVVKFDYGNQDTSGDKGKNNGLTDSWLSSSLQISPEEQTIFLQRLLNNELPASLRAHEMTRKILFRENLPDGWKLYGKTGSGSQLSQDKSQKLDLQIGWFVGWLQRNNRTIVFAYYLEDDEKKDTYASLRAQAAAKERLLHLIKEDI